MYVYEKIKLHIMKIGLYEYEKIWLYIMKNRLV